MSSLTVSLAILGGLVLAAVVIQGAWQTRKAGPKRASVPTPGPQEPMLDPHLSDLHPEPQGPLPQDHLNPPSEGGAASTPEPDAALPKSFVKKTSVRLDALLDAIAPITLDAPISGEMLLSHLPPSRRAGSKPLLIEARHVDSGEWEFPMPGQRYAEVQAGVQLANRTGALNNIEFSEFAQKVQLLAEALGGMADVPDMLESTARAREIDAFASQHDAQLAVHLRARSAAWSVGYILQHAGRHGFVPGAIPGRLVLPANDEGGPPVLTLTFDAQAALDDDPNQAVRDVTLSFDVPQTDAQFEPFVTWQASAQALSLGMDAAIVDDNGHPLTPEGFNAIGHELGRLYQALESRDMAAGSALARRLFS